MIRFPNAAQRRQRQQRDRIVTVCRRTLFTIAVLLLLCVKAPVIALAASAVGQSAMGLTHEQANNVFAIGCNVARATVSYAILCEAN